MLWVAGTAEGRRCWGAQRDPSAVPLLWVSGINSPFFSPLHPNRGCHPLNQAGKVSGLLLGRGFLFFFFSRLMHRITLMGLNSSSQATRGKNNKLLDVRRNYGPSLFRVSLVDLGPLCSIVPAALSIGAGETQVGNFIAGHVQGKDAPEPFRGQTVVVRDRGRCWMTRQWDGAPGGGRCGGPGVLGTRQEHAELGVPSLCPGDSPISSQLLFSLVCSTRGGRQGKGSAQMDAWQGAWGFGGFLLGCFWCCCCSRGWHRARMGCQVLGGRAQTAA